MQTEPCSVQGATCRVTRAGYRVQGAGRLWAILLAVVSAASLGSVAPAIAQDVGIPVGRTPEAVQLEDLDGRAVDLAQWVGQGPVLLQFWATWCPICQALQPRLDAAYDRFGDDVAFIAVAVGVNQSPRSIRRHLERHPIPYSVLWDGRGRATRAYMAPTTGYVVILDADGKVAYTGVGEDQEIGAALEEVLSGGS